MKQIQIHMLKSLLILSAFLLLGVTNLEAGNNSKFIYQNVPTTLNPGQNFNVYMLFENTGTTTWYVNGSMSWWLGSESPRDNFTWGTNRVSMVNTTVNPGGYFPFQGTLTAPSQAGEYEFQWQMLQNYVEWFGQKTPKLYIKVGNVFDGAQFISQQVPAVVLTNRNFTVSLVYKNTGNSIWKKGTYYLASEAPPGNSTWGTSRIDLPNNVKPGQTVTITKTLRAPSTAGDYIMQWRPSKGGNSRFGDISTAISIEVLPLKNGPALSVNDKKSDKPNITIMPNPATDVLKVKFPSQKEEYAIRLFDLTGKVVYQSASNSKNSIINVSDLKRGVYFLSAKSATQEFQQKVILQ